VVPAVNVGTLTLPMSNVTFP